MLNLFYVNDPASPKAGQIVAFQQGDVADAPPAGCAILTVADGTLIPDTAIVDLETGKLVLDV